MMQRIPEMPAGTVGVRATGKLTRHWVASSMHAFAWAIPAELMIGGLDELGEAKDWLAT